MKKPLFSLTKKDFEVKTFNAGGPGGQHQNKTDSGVRITHRASGACGESRDHRSQHRNKKIAFRRLAESKKFKMWLRLEVAARAKGHVDAKAMVDKMMSPKNLRVEVRDEDAWMEEET